MLKKATDTIGICCFLRLLVLELQKLEDAFCVPDAKKGELL